LTHRDRACWNTPALDDEQGSLDILGWSSEGQRSAGKLTFIGSGAKVAAYLVGTAGGPHWHHMHPHKCQVIWQAGHLWIMQDADQILEFLGVWGQ
jgi:hypothetical protein